MTADEVLLMISTKQLNIATTLDLVKYYNISNILNLNILLTIIETIQKVKQVPVNQPGLALTPLPSSTELSGIRTYTLPISTR